MQNMAAADAANWARWSREDVAQWLGGLGLAKYQQVFLDNEISGDILPELDHDVMRDEFGISAFGHRVRILKEIQALIHAGDDAAAVPPPSSRQPASPARPNTAADAEEGDEAPPQRVVYDHNSLHLVVLHAAPLVIKDSKGRIYPMEKLDLEAERRAITNSLLTDVQHKAIHVRFDNATADILRSLMTAWTCKVLHFSGHGLGQNPALCFEDGAGCTHMITPDLLRQLTFSGSSSNSSGAKNPADQRSVQLVFVNSCHSEKVASVFLNAGIPHVVAVHSDSLVVDASATMFAKHFYLSLFTGDTVSTAFEIAKSAVRALPTQKRAACCCAHVHEPNCPWMLSGSRHSHHNPHQCCCKGHALVFPHDESSKFLLLGGDGRSEAHDVRLFGDIPNGELTDHTPRSKCSIPSMHGQFIGRNSETYLMVKSLLENSVTACLGAPGIGKSSLVISVAHFVHSRRMFPDGVFYVDMESQKLSTVRYAIAQSIGMPAADTDDEVFAELGSKRCLLVLDKVEELLDEDEHKTQDLLGRLISAAPNTRLLLASRRIPHIPNVTAYSLSISELPLRTATELLCLVAPGCSVKLAEHLAKICGCLPLAIRVVGRALANARMTVTPEQMITYLERDERRFETIRELNQVGHKECVDRCIRSSFCHLEEPLRLAFMALGFFRGSFEVEAAEAVLSSPFASTMKASSSGVRSLTYSASGGASALPSSMSAPSFPGYAYGSARRTRDDDVSSIQSLGSQLSNMDEFSFENDGAMTNDSYDLLDLESTEEVKARTVKVFSAKVALETLHQWSLVEYDSRASRYRMHNLVQLFAEDEAGRLGEDADIIDSEFKRVSSFVSVSNDAGNDLGCDIEPLPFFPLGKELLLTWKRRFVRHYCVVVAKASHAYRFDGTLDMFDKERPNIESAMRLARELTVQSIEQVREAKRQTREYHANYDEEVDDACIGNDTVPKKDRLRRGGSGKTVKDSSIVDALLYSNLVVRSRFIFRARVDPRRRIEVLSSCLQLSRETRSLNCTCGNSENDPSTLLWDVDEAKHERELWILDSLPSFEEPQPAPPQPVGSSCVCIGIRELMALEALLLTDLGYASCDVTDWIAGEYHYLESLRLQRDVLGWSEHPQLAEVLNQLGICLSTQRGYLTSNVWLLQHAERLLKGSLMMRARVLGENHPEFATSLNNLANFYKYCGSFTAASAKRKSSSGDFRSVDDGGSEDGRTPAGEHQHHHRHHRHGSSSSRGRSVGSDRGSSTGSETSTAQSSTVADEPETKSEPDTEQQLDIEGMYRRSLKIREATLGRNHPQVAQSLNNVALFLSNQLDPQKLNLPQNESQRGEIIGLYDRALSIRRSTLGNASFETAATLNNIGNFKRLTRDWRGAEEHIKEALKITDRYFNDISPRAARIFINLARVYRDQERYEEAIAAYRKAQDIRHKLFPGSREVGFCIEQIGKCMRLQGNEEEGKRMEDQGRQMKKMGLTSAEDNSGMNEGSGAAFKPESPVHKCVARVNVLDVIDREALTTRRFNFAGKLLGERGIHLKKIEAIANCHVRYHGPWPSDPSRTEAYLQLTSATEQTLERARERCIGLLRELKTAWEQWIVYNYFV
uniref:SAM domain-containing protein n=1 Tax=Globisporangium ultimum (strain ATCC 200006 / CBS 805.95 / DAOM BR144) TaxID=431595 RepID=K3WBN9_GLOUD